MLQMSKHYEPEFKRGVRLHLEEDEPSKVLLPNMALQRQTSIWVKQFREECRQMKKPKQIMII